MTALDHDRARSETPPQQPGWRMSPILVLRHAGMPFEWVQALGHADEVCELADEVMSHEDTPGAALVEAHRRFEQRRAADLERLRAALHERARDASVREAVFLSNPTAYEGMWRSYVERDEIPDNARFRRVERQVYTYLQRFCAKNETVGTFGPMGYGEVDHSPGLKVQSCPQERRVLMSRWALEALARAVARDPELGPHVPMRRSALATVTPGQVRDGASGQVLELDQLTEALLHSIPEQGIGLAQLAAARGLTLPECAARVRPLLAATAVVRSLVFPAEVIDGLAALRDALLALPELPARERWIGELDDLAAGLDAFAAAALDRRRTLLGELEQRFEQLAGVPAQRGAGAVYADRLILFEEAASTFALSIGPDVAERIERAVGPALDLSTAFGSHVQDGYRREMAARLCDAGGELDFFSYAGLAESAAEHRPRVSALGLALDGQDGDGPVALDAGDFGPVPSGDRYALPDVCLAMPAPTDAGGDGCTVVVSRVHHHLLVFGWLATFHPDAGRFDAVAREWLEGTDTGRATLALGTTRRNKGFYRFPGPRLVITPLDSERHPDSTPAQDCRVVLRDGAPALVDATGRSRYLYVTLEDLTRHVPLAALAPGLVAHARVASEGGHLGRVLAGPAVYQREWWDVEMEEMQGASSAEAFLALRRLARRHGLPRFVFARVEHERKPYLIDTESPFAAELLRHLAKPGGRARLEEMLPGPGQLWLRDERGSYTCELRVQFVRDHSEEEI